MDGTEDLRVLLGSRHSLICAEMRDERRFLDLLRGIAGELGLPMWVWSITRGLCRDGGSPVYQTTDVLKALAFLDEVDAPGIFVFADAHGVLGDHAVVRRIKEAAQAGGEGRTLILTAPHRVLPPELSGLAVPWKLRPPGAEDLAALVRRTAVSLVHRGIRADVDDETIGGLVDALRGLTLSEAEQLLEQAARRDGALTPDDVAYVRGEKAQRLESGGVLEVVESSPGSLADVGGMDALKAWLELRGSGLRPDAREFGLEPPRGVLITGVPGCGKSLVAKALARAWSLPLVLLDPARVYGKYVGESEQRVADALEAVDAMAPVVLWIDEIEKGFSSGGEGDGGVSRRVLGTFLRWMQERPPGVFIAATSNDVRSLPPELLRKGRFDEIFFVDLPQEGERRAILDLHLRRRGRDPAAFDVDRLVGASAGFTGAEIEAAVVGALYRAYGAGEEVDTADVLHELDATVPLSVSRAEDVAALRAWAAERAVAASQPEPAGRA